MVGNAGRQAPHRRPASASPPSVLGALAAVGYLAIYVSDGMNGGAGFLFD